MSLDTLLAIPEAARKYHINEKRLRGAIWTNRLTDPIGSLETDQVYDDWRLKALADKQRSLGVR
jgi:hypothetical protein